MTTQGDVETLAKSLKQNGLAASDEDALRMAEKMLGISKSPEQRFEERQEKKEDEQKPEPQIEEKPTEETKEEPEPVKLNDIEPVEKKENFDVTKDKRTVQEIDNKGGELEENEEVSGFKEIPVEEKKEKPTLTEKEKKSVDLSKWFYYGNK